MVKIRLLKKGRKGQPCYSIIAIDSRKKRDSGSYLQNLGFYNPYLKELKLDYQNIDKWIKNGAQITLAVENLLKSGGQLEK